MVYGIPLSGHIFSEFSGYVAIPFAGEPPPGVVALNTIYSITCMLIPMPVKLAFTMAQSALLAPCTAISKCKGVDLQVLRPFQGLHPATRACVRALSRQSNLQRDYNRQRHCVRVCAGVASEAQLEEVDPPTGLIISGGYRATVARYPNVRVCVCSDQRWLAWRYHRETICCTLICASAQ